MKKTIAKLLALALCAGLLCLPARAAGEKEGETPERAPYAPVLVWGTLTEIEGGGLLLTNSNEGSGQEPTIVLHGENILCLDAVTGDPVALKDADGETVYAYVGPAMAASLPPQTTAHLILTNIPADFAVPAYYQVTAVTASSERSVTVETDQGVTLTVPKSAQVFPYLTKNIVTMQSLTPGTRILVWKDGKDAVAKVMVFAYGYRGYLSVTDEAVSLTGEKVEAEVRKDADGRGMLPLRPLAEAAGLQVSWDGARGAVVSQAGKLLFSVKPGASKALTDLDVEESLTGPCVLEDGVTYLYAADAAKLLNLFLMG